VPLRSRFAKAPLDIRDTLAPIPPSPPRAAPLIGQYRDRLLPLGRRLEKLETGSYHFASHSEEPRPPGTRTRPKLRAVSETAGQISRRERRAARNFPVPQAAPDATAISRDRHACRGNARIKAGERARIDRLGLSYAEAARRLGLTPDGLQKKMRGDRPIGRQTEIILDLMDELRRLQNSRGQSKPPVDRQQRRDRRLAQYLYPSPPRRK